MAKALDVLAVVAVLALPADAAAQRFSPEPLDYDHAAERHSDFWEQALAADRRRYDNAVERAAVLIGAGDDEGLAAARAELAAAIPLAPDDALGHYWLGRAAAAQGDWAACASSLGAAFRIDATWVPPVGKAPAPWLLDFELGECLARAGDYEGAIAHYRRILSAGHTDASRVHWRLGEAYMALGRLAEAIESLRTAARLSADADIRFALAVALDRDEELAEAGLAMAQARARDPRLDGLLAVDRVFSPAADRHYYLALAHAAGDERGLALHHMRRYLAAAKDSPWTARARAHLEDLGRFRIGDDLDPSGSAAIDGERVRAAVRAAAGDFERCAAPVPSVLLQVRITALARGGGHARVEPGVRVLVLDQGDAAADTLRAAVGCAERVAARLQLPPVQGSPGSYATVTFSVLAR